MRVVLQDLKNIGVFSASNIGPSISYVDKDSEIYRVLTKSGITLDNEIAMLKLAKEMDMVSVGLAFDEEDSLRIVKEADPDIFCFHAGTTKGGLKGYDSGENMRDLKKYIGS
jgi:predicted TIM-barrel enzyme